MTVALKGKAVFADFQDLDIRTVHRGDPCFFGNASWAGGILIVDRVLKEHALTVPHYFLNHMPGRFALAETGNGDGRAFSGKNDPLPAEFLGAGTLISNSIRLVSIFLDAVKLIYISSCMGQL